MFKSISRHGQENDFWPLALLLFAALLPALVVLWFMGAAMRNERLAARQKLADAYGLQLSVAQRQLEDYWNQRAVLCERCVRTNAAAAAFAGCVESGTVDSLVLFDAEGRISYPSAPSPVLSNRGEAESPWQEASKLEHGRKYTEAAKRYDHLAREAAYPDVAARGFQAEGRCLAQAGQTDAAVRLIDGIFSNGLYDHALDAQGRLIAANCELLALEMSKDRNAAVSKTISRRLAARLMDYGNSSLKAPQRRFLMKQMLTLCPGEISFPTLAAEEIASELGAQIRRSGFDFKTEAHPSEFKREAGQGKIALRPALLPGLWQLTSRDHRALAIFHFSTLLAASQAAINSQASNRGVRITLIPPARDPSNAFVTIPAGDQMPGWRLVLSMQDQGSFDAMTARQTAVYFWSGILVIAAMGLLAMLTFRVLRRRMSLARLKNDLAATVSHELKTPLTSMRVLVDTLLDSATLDDKKTREYLHLIAGENERLGRLIQNFLTFSRMEKKKYAFRFSPLPASQIIDAAAASVRGLFNPPGCPLELRVQEKLPPILADADALSAALINLLENAHHYSEPTKPVLLEARAENGTVTFSVRDHGVGISPRDCKRIFQPFYQIDQRLSRRGAGCGLGLSIVQFITAAHHGTVSVQSKPGYGSTFIIAVPAAKH